MQIQNLFCYKIRFGMPVQMTLHENKNLDIKVPATAMIERILNQESTENLLKLESFTNSNISWRTLKKENKIVNHQ